jgi:hypothetical protein
MIEVTILTVLTLINAGALLLISRATHKALKVEKKIEPATPPPVDPPSLDDLCDMLAVRAWHGLCKETGGNPDLLAGKMLQLLRAVLCYENHSDESWDALLNKIEKTVWK